MCTVSLKSLQWRHNDRHGVWNHQPHHYLLNRLFRHRSKKTSKLRVTGLCAGIHRWSANSPHKWPVTRKMFPFDDVIMICNTLLCCALFRCSWLINLGLMCQNHASRTGRGNHPPYTSHRYCRMWLLVPAIDTCFWHTSLQFWTGSCDMLSHTDYGYFTGAKGIVMALRVA